MPSAKRRLLIAALLVGTTLTCASTLGVGVGVAVSVLRSTLTGIEGLANAATPASAAATAPVPEASRGPGEEARAFDEEPPAIEATIEDTDPARVDHDRATAAMRAAVEADPDIGKLIDDPDPKVRAAMRDFFDGPTDRAP